MTLDGTVYTFIAFVDGAGLLKGENYSAAPGSPPYQLGFLGEALRQMVDAPEDRRAWYEEQIAARARKLLQELESAP